MKHYVAGFLFDYDHSNVLLVYKKRPPWQVGKYNGIGGKVDKGENHYHAMVREFQEETGLYFNAWKPLVTMQYSEADEEDRSHEAALVSFWFGTQVAEEFEDFYSRTDEEVVSMPISVVRFAAQFKVQLTPGLSWMIPLALDDTAPKPLQNYPPDLVNDDIAIAYLKGP